MSEVGIGPEGSSTARRSAPSSATRAGILARARRRPWGDSALVIVLVAYLVWSLAPVAIALLFSFNDGYSRAIWQGFSLQWWTGPNSVFHDPIYTAAIRHSFELAALAMVITVPLGVSLAVFLGRWRGRSSRPASFVATLPLVVPELVLSLALLFLVTKLLHFVSLGTPGQVIGQVTFILPLVIVITRGRMAAIPIGYEEAALDLGASRLAAFRLVLVPLLGPAILASAIVTFAVSIDDFVITQYMSSSASTTTVPMLIYNSTRGDATPALNATAIVMAMSTLVISAVGYIFYRLLLRRERIPELVADGADLERAGTPIAEGAW